MPDSHKRPHRIAFVNTHPIQYFAPMYAHLNKEKDLDITAIYMSDFSLRGEHDPGFNQNITWDIDLLEGYTPIFAGEKAKKRNLGGFFSMIAPEIWGIIKHGEFDAIIIHGHYLAGHYMALIAAKRFNVPVFLRGETHMMLHRSAIKERIRTAIYKPLFKLFTGFLAIGSANREYYQYMGAKEDQISLVPYTVENNRFISASKIAKKNAGQLRSQYSIKNDAVVILFASKFEPRKRALDLLKAYKRIKKPNPKAHLLFVGSGEEEAQLQELVRSERIEDVSFAGFINQSELPNYFAISDIFVLPSDNEPWGLVINEAMCASLPIITTAGTGSAQDLVIDGTNGVMYTAGDIDALASALAHFVADDLARKNASTASLNRIQNWSYAECATGIRAALEKLETDY